MDADPEPGHAVAAGDAHQAKCHDRGNPVGWETFQPTEIDYHHRADEQLKHENEFALRNEVGLVRLIDQLRDVAHRAMNGQIAKLEEHEDPKRNADERDHETGHE